MRNGEKKSLRNNPANTKAREEGAGGGGGAPGNGAEIPGQPVGETTVEQIATPQPTEDPTPDQVAIPCRNRGLCRAHAEAGSWQEMWPLEDLIASLFQPIPFQCLTDRSGQKISAAFVVPNF